MPRLARALAIAVGAIGLAAAPASAASPDIVVSQAYGGGGNSGATYTNDFVELFNRGTEAVDLTGWTVQYGSSGGTTWQSTVLGGSIAPGRHFLVQEAPGAGGTTPLPAPDASGTIAMSGTAGKVRVLTAGGAVRDLVGYGSANESETAPTPGTSNTTAAIRNDDGCADTDDNRADFTIGAPAPRNLAAAATPCGGPPADDAPRVASVDPPAGAADVARDANVTVTFSEPVDAAGDAFELSCGGTAVPVTVSGGPTVFTVDPDADLPQGGFCRLTVRAAGVTDQDPADPPDHPAGDFASTFTTVGLALRIHEIQGAAQVSPHVGDVVSKVPGIVTGVSGNGFWFQDAQPDSDVRTSEGIFVFTSSRPAVAAGDEVAVSGTVQEFRSSSGPNDLSTTELGFATVTRTGTGAIAPTVIGRGGRVPPNRTIEDDASGDVADQTAFDPEHDGIDFHESLEGMLVEIHDAVATGPSVSFGEIPVVADGGADAGLRTARGGVLVRPDDFNPERMILDDSIEPTPTDVDVRDGLGTVQAIVDYSFGNYKYEVTSTPVRTSGGLQREITAAPRANQLAVASFNVENLAPGDPATKYARLASTLVNNLRAPDLVAVEEIQDNTGARNDHVVAADQTWSKLIAAIQAAGGPTYDYRQIDPVDLADGGAPGGNIRQGFLFRTDRGLAFVDRPGGTATNATDEDATQRGAQLTLSPGRLDPANEAFTDSRKPLAGEFRWKGRPVFVVANHFNSKGGDDALFGRIQPPVRSSEAQRHQQAAVVNAFVKRLERADPRAHVVVLGDLNDFDFSETLDILKGRELFNLVDLLPKPERYSYVFEGNSQVLDQILVSRPLLLGHPQYDSVHVNSEFHDQDSDHDPQVARLRVIP
jgi:predicted extracellular nuclease